MALVNTVIFVNSSLALNTYHPYQEEMKSFPFIQHCISVSSPPPPPPPPPTTHQQQHVHDNEQEYKTPQDGDAPPSPPPLVVSPKGLYTTKLLLANLHAFYESKASLTRNYADILQTFPSPTRFFNK